MKLVKMFGFLSLNRIFFSQMNNLPRFARSTRISFGISLLSFFLALLLGVSAILTFPVNSFAEPLVAIDAVAGDTATTETGVRSAKGRSDISPDKLEQFAQAYFQVLQLLSDRQAELPEDETSPAALEIQQSIEADTISLIQGSGLTLPEYMQILEMASQDETFQRKIFE